MHERVVPNPNSHYFALCLVVKDERREYLREWIEYHWRLGCSKFYIYDNNSSVPLINHVLDYSSAGLVEYSYLMSPKYPTAQIYAYERCIKDYGSLHNFMGFIDSDEFIVIRGRSSIPEVLHKYSRFGGLTLSWIYFGSSGHQRRPNREGVISNYHKCIPDFHIKTIVNTKYVIGPSGEPHSFRYKVGYHAVDTSFRRVRGPFNPARNASPELLRNLNLYSTMYINHYVIRSFEDYEEKMQRGTVDGGVRNMKYFERIDSIATDSCQILAMPLPQPQRKQLGWHRNLRVAVRLSTNLWYSSDNPNILVASIALCLILMFLLVSIFLRKYRVK